MDNVEKWAQGSFSFESSNAIIVGYDDVRMQSRLVKR